MAKTSSSLAASTQVVTTPGAVTGIIVNSHTSGVIKLIDSPNGAIGRVIFGGAAGYALPSGPSVIYFSEIGLEYYEGLYFVLVSGSGDFQLVYNNSVGVH